MNRCARDNDTPMNRCVRDNDTPMNRCVRDNDTPMNRYVRDNDTPGSIISLRCEVWTHQTSLSPSLFIEVLVASHQSE
jgi:hypothetical protein